MLLHRVIKPSPSSAEDEPAQLVIRPLPHSALLIHFFNARLVTDDGLVDGELWVQDGKIVDPQARFWSRAEAASTQGAAADRRIDCKGLLLAPGFIDCMLHSAFGIDFSSLGGEGPKAADEARRAMRHVQAKLPSLGVTAFCPTIRPCAPEVCERLLERLAPQPVDGDEVEGAAILGAHLDGPFFTSEYAPSHLGTSERGCLRQSFDGGGHGDPLVAAYGSRLWAHPPAVVTLAPELPGAIDAIRRLSAEGVVVGIGRTAAGLAQCQAAVAAGARLVTHVYSDMPLFHHRDPGPIGLLADRDAAAVEAAVSADAVEAAEGGGGKPVSPPPGRRGSKRDHSGAPAGNSSGGGTIYYSMAVEQQHSNTSNLAYSTHPDGLVLLSERKPQHDGEGALPQCARQLQLCSGAADPSKALLCGSAHPAKLLKLAAKGSLEPDSDADLVLLDPETFVVRACFVAGRLTWEDENLHGSLWFH
jgi:N-acetylglucosamine-6-phosphate deacetylase